MQWETWIYGNGDQARLRIEAGEEHGAAENFLNRYVFGSKGYGTFAETLVEHGVGTVKVCVKNPGKKGTRKHPNYPTVYTFTHTDEGWVFHGSS